MREIEFRAYSISLKRMLSFEHLKEATEGMVDVANAEIQKRNMNYNKLAPYGLFLPLEDDDLEFMQYTGLIDKNGKKIFEGDIVRFNNQIFAVKMDCGSFGLAINENINYDRLLIEIKKHAIDFWGCYCDNFISLFEIYWNFNGEENVIGSVEVIGNIYDNPELIKESNNE